MRPIPEFVGTVGPDGKLRLEHRAEFDDYIHTFEDQRVVLTVRKFREQRSAAQNRWLWGKALPLIAEYCGYDEHETEDLHYDLLGVRFGTVEVEPRFPGAPHRVVPAKTSSQLTTAEFSEYMDWLVRFAAQKWGVMIPLPDESTVAA